jgi:hypothetical protein
MSRVYDLNDNFLDKLDKKSAWFVGIMAADGNINKNKKFFSISQSGDHGKKIIEYIKKLLNFNGNMLTYYPKNGQYSVKINCTSPELIKDLFKFNVGPNKSLIYQFPKNMDENFFASFLRGYFEGDGCVGIYDNGKGSKYFQLSFVGTYNFIKDCSNIIPIKGNMIKKNANNCFELRWYSKKALLVADWLYKDDDLYQGIKYEIIQDAKKIKNKKEKPDLRLKAFELLKQNIKPEEIAKQIGVAFQTVYKWRKQLK